MIKTAKLFSYDNLQFGETQLNIFGRKLVGQPDVLPGYRLSELIIRDPHIMRVSGKIIHIMVRYTGQRRNLIKGTLFKVTWPELLAADLYEAEDYKRVSAVLLSGALAWIYVSK